MFVRDSGAQEILAMLGDRLAKVEAEYRQELAAQERGEFSPGRIEWLRDEGAFLGRLSDAIVEEVRRQAGTDG